MLVLVFLQKNQKKKTYRAWAELSWCCFMAFDVVCCYCCFHDCNVNKCLRCTVSSNKSNKQNICHAIKFIKIKAPKAATATAKDNNNSLKVTYWQSASGGWSCLMCDSFESGQYCLNSSKNIYKYVYQLSMYICINHFRTHFSIISKRYGFFLYRNSAFLPQFVDPLA